MYLFIASIEDNQERTFMERLFEKHNSRMINIARKILNDNIDAEDAIQEAFIRIYKNIEKFLTLNENDLCLLLSIYSKNEALRLLKNRSKHSNISLNYDDDNGNYDIPDDSLNLDDMIIKKEYYNTITSYINNLPETQRHVIILRYKYNMNEREIADIVGTTDDAISARIRRAKDSLRSIIKEKFYE
jgi:RNA polymerase sigma factor, sigma-70 family